jgi:hypothetical protein
MIEQRLAETGIKRQIAVRLGHFSVAPDIVRDTDLAVIFLESVARRPDNTKAFRLLPLPFDPTADRDQGPYIPIRASPATWALAGCVTCWPRCSRKEVNAPRRANTELANATARPTYVWSLVHE